MKARLNLNPGTLGTLGSSDTLQAYDYAYAYLDVGVAVSVGVSAETNAFNGGLAGFPLGQYQEGRRTLRRLRARASEIWGHDESTIAFPPGGATAIFSALATALYPALAKDTLRIAVSSHEHEGATQPFQSHRGYSVDILADSHLRPDRFAEFVVGIRPDIVIISQISYTVLRLPVEELALAVRDLPERPIFIVDAAQSAGVLENLPSAGEVSGIDAVVASGHKWLFGPMGSGLLWMGPRLADLLRPVWGSGRPLDPDADLGFLEASGGQDFARLSALDLALKRYQSLGPAIVRSRSRELAEYFRARLSLILRERPHAMHGSEFGMLMCKLHAWDAYPLYVRLNGDGIHTKLIRRGLDSLWRFGFPHYETKERLDWALDAIARHLEVERPGNSHRAWTAHPNEKSLIAAD